MRWCVVIPSEPQPSEDRISLGSRSDERPVALGSSDDSQDSRLAFALGMTSS
jgi:hypothetical protein